MSLTVHDAHDGIADAIESTHVGSANARVCPLLRLVALRALQIGTHPALVEALRGDPAMAAAARRANAAMGAPARHPAFDACMADLGVDPDVAQALAPVMDGQASVETHDHWGVSWTDGRIRVQAPMGEGIVVDDQGAVEAYMEFPQIVAAAMAGRRLGDLIELPPALGDHGVLACTTGDGETNAALAWPATMEMAA